MILNMGVGKAREKMPPLYTISGGTSTYAQEVASNGVVNWELALLSGSNATLTFSRVVDKIDVFLVGGGKTGDTGNGGAGGQRLTATGVSVSSGTAYTFTVGGKDAATSIFNRTATSGGGAAGGRGGTNVPSAEKGGDGAYAFGKEASLLYSGRKYGAGGGGGGLNSRRPDSSFGGGAGGVTGGGTGAFGVAADGEAGAANTGSGGGGGYWDDFTYQASNGGAGGSGIIIIRNAR